MSLSRRTPLLGRRVARFNHRVTNRVTRPLARWLPGFGVVEEYEVTLLAESAEDAKARADADVRGGGHFESIEDRWSEEGVAVEALAVEPYPDLE